jgi:C4-dicarboxylate-specific signal transduction histidine kinase
LIAVDVLQLLLVEDEPLDAELVRRSLRSTSSSRVRLHHVTTLGAGLDRLDAGGIDAVLLDLNVSDSAGVNTVVRLRERDPAVPVVVFTVAGDDATAVAALAAGAQDYLVKEELGGALLRRSIRHAIERRRIAAENESLQRRLRRAEKMESLGALCGGIAFGFNAQLGAIFDHCENALASLGASGREAQLRAALLEIHRAAFRSAEMVQRLRDYSALERSASDDVDLARFVLEASEFLATIVSAEIDVVCDAAGEPLRVEIERPELHRALVSLVVNAAEAIGDQRGSISISTGSLEVDDALLAGARGAPDAKPGTYAFLRVADTGRGLDAVQRERIFDPFYTTKLAGRGLGLASVLGILQQRRGVVRVESNHPAGTIFTLLLPRATAA